MNPLTTHTRQKSTGFCLVEVLVALLVLATGALGMAALQTSALRASQQAMLHTRALQLATDLVERMHADPQGVRRGDYRLQRGRPVPTTGLGDWQTRLVQLPAGTAEVVPCPTTACTTTRPGAQRITLYWNARQDTAASTAHSPCPPRTADQPRCVSLLYHPAGASG